MGLVESMNIITLIDKNDFANLFRYGEILIPEYVSAEVDDTVSEEQAISSILESCNPITTPSNWIIVRHTSENSKILNVTNIKSLAATNDDGYYQFTTQFREDIIIEKAQCGHLFQNYLNTTFQEKQIIKGIKAFRTLCGLDTESSYCDEAKIILEGLNCRLRYGHHHLLPAECRTPYNLMIVYDRHSTYPNSWFGYFCDVIETLFYHIKPDLGYEDAIAERTSVYSKISHLGDNLQTKVIVDAIKDEQFVKDANEIYSLPGGYLAPYIFYILRDRFRKDESFKSHLDLIARIKQSYPEAFDTAATFVGGFFGYEKFYDDYYSMLDLSIIRKHNEVIVEPKVIVPEQIEEIPHQGSLNFSPEGTGSEPGNDLLKIVHGILLKNKTAKKTLPYGSQEILEGIKRIGNNKDVVDELYESFRANDCGRIKNLLGLKKKYNVLTKICKDIKFLS